MLVRTILIAMIVCSISVASPASEIPNPFVMNSGSVVSDSKQWEARRAEMIQHLLEGEYGHPPPVPDSYRLENTQNQNVYFRNEKIWGTLYTANMVFGPNDVLSMKVGYWKPRDDTAKLPTILAMEPVWWENPFWNDPRKDWQIVPRLLQQRVLFAGFNVYPEDGTTGLGNFEDPNYRPAADVYPGYTWRMVAVGAWGYRVAMNFVADQTCMDRDRVAIWGHSRRAKSVLLAGALDERFPMVVADMSGSAGAAVWKVENDGTGPCSRMKADFPHWLLDSFPCNDVHSLPFDQHFLHSLVAPRYLLSHVAGQCDWDNHYGEQVAYFAGKQVYKWLGAEGHLGIHFGSYGHIDPGLRWEPWDVLLQWMNHHFIGQTPTKNMQRVKHPDAAKRFSWTSPRGLRLGPDGS